MSVLFKRGNQYKNICGSYKVATAKYRLDYANTQSVAESVTLPAPSATGYIFRAYTHCRLFIYFTSPNIANVVQRSCNFIVNGKLVTRQSTTNTYPGYFGFTTLDLWKGDVLEIKNTSNVSNTVVLNIMKTDYLA